MDELDENGVRRLLAYVAAAGIAGGQPVHEVEADTRSVGRYPVSYTHLTLPTNREV